jgi:hypothetical protein
MFGSPETLNLEKNEMDNLLQINVQSFAFIPFI